MLFLTEKLLKAAGIEYDEILDTWIVPVPLPPVVTVECDEAGAYIMEALVEVHAVLHANGVTYKNFAITGGYLSLVGLTTMELAADVGLPADEHRDLADALRDLGVPVGEAVIPSIRCIVKVE